MPKGDFWDKIKSRLIEVSNAAADFTEEQAVVGKLKFDILNLNRKIDHEKHDIGEIVVQIYRSGDPYDPLIDSEVIKRINSIGELEASIVFKRAEIARAVEEIRSRRHQSGPTASPKKGAAPAGKPAASKAAEKSSEVTKKPAPATVKKSPAKKPATPKAVKSEPKP